MSKRIVVSRAEQKAAQYVLKNNAAKGRPTSASVTRIANAKASRPATSGRVSAETKK